MRRKKPTDEKCLILSLVGGKKGRDSGVPSTIQKKKGQAKSFSLTLFPTEKRGGGRGGGRAAARARGRCMPLKGKKEAISFSSSSPRRKEGKKKKRKGVEPAPLFMIDDAPKRKKGGQPTSPRESVSITDGQREGKGEERPRPPRRGRRVTDCRGKGGGEGKGSGALAPEKKKEKEKEGTGAVVVL